MSYNFNTNIEDLTFVVSDIETSGMSRWNNTIVEIAAVTIEPPLNLNPHNVFNSLVNPRGEITPDVTAIHGITDGMVADAPGIEAVIAEYTEFVDGKVLVFHNAAFDFNIISKVWRTLKMRPHVYVLDTLKLSRKLNRGLEHHKLDDLIYLYGLEPLRSGSYRHRALYDSDMTAAALMHMLKQLEDMGIFTFGDLFDFHG